MKAVERKVFECAHCGHVSFLYVDKPRCRKCGSQTGVVKLIDEETTSRMLLESRTEIGKDPQG